MPSVGARFAFLWLFCLTSSVGIAWDAGSSGFPVMDRYELGRLIPSDQDGPVSEGAVGAFGALKGEALVAGADSVILFDGSAWSRIPIPGAYAVRGIAIDAASSRIYIGAVGEMGYLERSSGSWHYLSLLPKLVAARIEPPAEIWEVAATERGVCFVTAQSVLRYEPQSGKLESWHLPCRPRLIPVLVDRPSRASAAEQELWLYQAGAGLLRMGAEGPEKIWAEGELPETPIAWVLPMPGQNFLLGTSDAVYARSSQGWHKLPRISAAIEGKLPACAAALGDGNVAIGTYAGGVVVADPADRVLAIIDHAHGLPDDHVQALWLDSAGGLWVGMSGWMARITVAGRSSEFDARSGLAETPLVKVVEAGGGQCYALSAKSGYRLADGRLRLLPGLVTQIRDAAGTAEELWVAGFGGIWRQPAESLAPAEPERVYFDAQSVWKVLPLAKDRLLFASGRVLKELVPSPHGGWAAHDLNLALEGLPTGMTKGTGDDIWITTRTSGVYRFKWIKPARHTAGRLQLIAGYLPGRGLPSGATRPVVAKAGSHVALFLSVGASQPISGIYELRDDDQSSGFAPAVGLENYAGLAPVEEQGADSTDDYWIVHDRRVSVPGVIRVIAEKSAGGTLWRAEPVEVAGLDRVGSVTTASRIGQALWIGGAQELLRAELPARPEAVRSPPGVHIWSADSPAGPRRFEFASPEAIGGAAVFYQTRLSGAEDDWSAPTRIAERQFTQLAPGSYRFEVKALDRWGRSGPESVIAFAVPRPGWETWPAIAGYAAVSALLATAIWRRRVSALERRNAELDLQVRERTRQLSERTRELEMSNAAKSEFLETISHEIRNPLNGLQGMVTMLNETTLAGTQREMMTSLSACAGALTRTFDEVLNFAKVEAGQVPVRRQPFDLPALVEDVVALHRVAANQAGCEVRILGEWSASSRRWIGDPEKIRTIVSNFLSNAIKYAPGKPIEIRVEIEAEEADSGALVMIEVRDNGEGIEAEEQSVIFSKFARGAKAKALRVPGTGLGLASCQALAAQMEGFVGLESPSISRVTGDRIPGATFFLKLPLKPAVASGAAASPPPLTPANPGPGTAVRRVLIAEDQDYNQKVAIRIARRLGLEPEVASDGREALAKLQSRPYDVLFVDWEMPGIKGDEIARHVRSLPWGKDAFIVATTGHDSEEIKRACLAGGMDAFVVKPYDEETMRAALAGLAPDHLPAGRTSPTGEVDQNSGLKLSFFSLMGDGDPDKTRQAAREFLASLAQESEAIERAIAGSNWALAASGAHRLRSLVGLVRAERLRGIAKTFQLEAEQADPFRREELRQQLAVETALLRQQIEAAL